MERVQRQAPMNSAALKEVRRLAEARRLDEALEMCNRLLGEAGGDPTETLRTRAYIFALAGDYESAQRDRTAVLDADDATLRDLYQAAEVALKLRQLDTAARLFDETIRRGEKEGEEWFKSAALFYLSFLRMEMDDLDGALELTRQVKSVDADCELPVPGVGVVSVKEMEREILKRKAQAR